MGIGGHHDIGNCPAVPSGPRGHRILAGAGVLTGNQLARWFGVAVVVALYALCVYGNRSNVTA